jgi:hypothetical protein
MGGKQMHVTTTVIIMIAHFEDKAHEVCVGKSGFQQFSFLANRKGE